MKNIPKKIFLRIEEDEIWCEEKINDSDVAFFQKPTPKKIIETFNAITSNGCREMDEIRFEQAVNEIFGELNG